MEPAFCRQAGRLYNHSDGCKAFIRRFHRIKLIDNLLLITKESKHDQDKADRIPINNGGSMSLRCLLIFHRHQDTKADKIFKD